MIMSLISWFMKFLCIWHIITVLKGHSASTFSDLHPLGMKLNFKRHYLVSQFVLFKQVDVSYNLLAFFVVELLDYDLKEAIGLVEQSLLI